MRHRRREKEGETGRNKERDRGETEGDTEGIYRRE
jgi:hypothetical protein